MFEKGKDKKKKTTKQKQNPQKPIRLHFVQLPASFPNRPKLPDKWGFGPFIKTMCGHFESKARLNRQYCCYQGEQRLSLLPGVGWRVAGLDLDLRQEGGGPSTDEAESTYRRVGSFVIPADLSNAASKQKMATFRSRFISKRRAALNFNCGKPGILRRPHRRP